MGRADQTEAITFLILLAPAPFTKSYILWNTGQTLNLGHDLWAATIVAKCQNLTLYGGEGEIDQTYHKGLLKPLCALVSEVTNFCI